MHSLDTCTWRANGGRMEGEWRRHGSHAYRREIACQLYVLTPFQAPRRPPRHPSDSLPARVQAPKEHYEYVEAAIHCPSTIPIRSQDPRSSTSSSIHAPGSDSRRLLRAPRHDGRAQQPAESSRCTSDRASRCHRMPARSAERSVSTQQAPRHARPRHVTHATSTRLAMSADCAMFIP